MKRSTHSMNKLLRNFQVCVKLELDFDQEDQNNSDHSGITQMSIDFEIC
jgi:hypothetical protein